MIADNIKRVRERIIANLAKANRDPSEVKLVVVTKGRSLSEIFQALEAGITDLGENKVQEALLKYAHLTPDTHNLKPIKWHMIGHLQTNKVKDAVRIFDCIDSVDSLRLAKEIDKQAGKLNKIQDILLEIKTSPEATKFGVKPEEVTEVIKEAALLKNIKIKGLMTIAPVVSNSEEARVYFKRLRQILDEINTLLTVDCRLSTLSMGMTDDFEVAIQEGATMVRIGRAIFSG